MDNAHSGDQLGRNRHELWAKTRIVDKHPLHKHRGLGVKQSEKSEILSELLNRDNLVLEMPQEEDLVDYKIYQDIVFFTIGSHIPDLKLHNRLDIIVGSFAVPTS